MGWFVSYEKPRNVKQSLIEELGPAFECLECKLKMNTAYMAVRKKDSGEVFAVVVLMRYYGKEFGTKWMDETVGPVESDCPKSILEKLTPTEFEWAKQWRERCWANVRRREAANALRDGDRVRFKDPIRFENGQWLQEFAIYKNPRSRVLRFTDNVGNLYRISNWKSREFTKI